MLHHGVRLDLQHAWTDYLQNFSRENAKRDETIWENWVLKKQGMRVWAEWIHVAQDGGPVDGFYESSPKASFASVHAVYIPSPLYPLRLPVSRCRQQLKTCEGGGEVPRVPNFDIGSRCVVSVTLRPLYFHAYLFD